MRYGRVCPDLIYVRQRNFERTLERPQHVGSSDVQDQIAPRNGEVHHVVLLSNWQALLPITRICQVFCHIEAGRQFFSFT
jgi:hypothetical protein